MITPQSNNIAEPEYVDLKNYLGNPLLKRPGVQFEVTPELALEYNRCAKDPVHFIETYIKIINPDEGLVPFKLRDYQREIVLSLHNHRNTIITTARQAGKSTTMISYLLWYILFNEHKLVALTANKGETARELLGKLKLAYQYVPKWLQSGVIEWRESAIELENGSRAIADATSADALRGYAINMLVIDEAAHIEDWESFSASVLPTITASKTSKIVQISTPCGLNHFHATWENAKQGKNNYNWIEVPWVRVPGRDAVWKEAALADLNFDEDKFEQEYGCQFLGSSGTLIGGWKLKELVAKRPIFSDRAGLRKYFDPIEAHQYAITVDCSEGKGFDHSAFHVIDITQMPFQEVCVFNDNVTPPPELAQMIYTAAQTYNKASILIEHESMGPEVADCIYNDLEYENVLMTESAGARGKRLTTRGGKNIDKGLKMTQIVKNTGCSILKLLIEQNQLIINDEKTIKELMTFSRDGKTFKAEEGKNDDLVMALVVFGWLSNQPYFKELTDINTMALLREKTEDEVMQELIPFGFSTNEEEEVLVDPEDPYGKWHEVPSDRNPANF